MQNDRVIISGGVSEKVFIQREFLKDGVRTVMIIFSVQ